jgi:hypothetical protein
VYAVDPWLPSDPGRLGVAHTLLTGTEDFLAFMNHVRPYRERLVVLPCRSRDVRWSGPPIAALFIDAIHTYDDVRADVEHFLPWLAPDAQLAFHDYLPERTVFPGVRQYIDEQLLASGEWRWDDFRGCLLTLQRVTDRRQDVVAHNGRCVERARQRILEIAAATGA